MQSRVPFAILFVAITFTGAAVAAEQLTIPEIIEKVRPEVPRWTGRVREFAPRPFDDAVRTSTLIVRGTVHKLRTYLSADETELYTDFELRAGEVIAGELRRSATVPGPAPIIVRQWGGKTIVNGVDVEIKDEDIPMLPTNTPLLLFLNYNEKLGKYEVFDEGIAAFQVVNGRTFHNVRSPVPSYQRWDDLDIARVVLEVRRLRR